MLFAIFRLVNPDLTKSISIQDCKSEYKMSVFGPEYKGFRYHKAKMVVDKCFYKKYIQNYHLQSRYYHPQREYYHPQNELSDIEGK